MKRVFKEHGTCCVWISTTERGEVLLNGQDLGGVFGASEYEYAITIKPSDFDVIRTALNGAEGEDIVELMCANAQMIFSAGENSWLEGLGVETDFWARYELEEDRS